MNKQIVASKLIIAALLLGNGPVQAEDAQKATGKATIGKPCVMCHEAEDHIIRGTLANVSNKAGTVQVVVGEDTTWLIRFDNATSIAGAETLAAIKKDHEVAVTYVEKDGKLLATQISSKPAAKVAPEKLLSTADVKELILKSPEEGNYLLIDSRPGPKFQEGYIPNAVSLPFPSFDKQYPTVLPENKDITLVFYCGGVT